MKFIFTILTIVLSYACSSQETAYKNKKLSIGQMFLHHLRDSLKIEYSQAISEQEKNLILSKYHDKLEAYLLVKPIDTISVKVDEIVRSGMTVTTRLHDNDIEFQYSLNFGSDSMSTRVLKAYNFMIGLKPGTDTTANFDFTGACRVNKPDDITTPTFRIFAFPIPLELNGK
jgi:hypothetical protein